MRVCLDPGHGGRQPGACANGIIEAAWALTFAERLGHYLRAAGAETVFTRRNTEAVALGDRGKVAKRHGCDLFVSIHANAAGNANAQGAEVLVAKGDERSKARAKPVLAAIVAGGMRDRGVKWDDQGQHRSLRVLRDTYRVMPAMLIEVGFVTSAHDAALMKSRQWVEDCACRVARALMSQ